MAPSNFTNKISCDLIPVCVVDFDDDSEEFLKITFEARGKIKGFLLAGKSVRALATCDDALRRYPENPSIKDLKEFCTKCIKNNLNENQVGILSEIHIAGAGLSTLSSFLNGISIFKKSESHVYQCSFCPENSADRHSFVSHIIKKHCKVVGDDYVNPYKCQYNNCQEARDSAVALLTHLGNHPHSEVEEYIDMLTREGN